jgi:hypothetical protein
MAERHMLKERRSFVEIFDRKRQCNVSFHARDLVADTNRLGRHAQVLGETALDPHAIRVGITRVVFKRVDT